MRARTVESTFLQWTFLRAVFHRGYTLTSSLYFVTVAHLSAAQLLGLVVVISAVYLVADIPFGAWADTFSRKWSLVIGHAVLAACMVLTGVVRSFDLVAITQVLWALGWSFSMGADVAWITDELDAPDRMPGLLTARARYEIVGGASGMLAFGLAGAVWGLAPAIVGAGAGIACAGLLVARRFPEENFARGADRGLRASTARIRRGYAIARRDRVILVAFAATVLVEGAGVVSWLVPKQLVGLGYPGDPVLWYTALGIVASAAGFAALRMVDRRAHASVGNYMFACAIGASGLVVLALAPNALVGSIGAIVFVGVTGNVARAISTIWVNERTTSNVRATVLSFLSQAETIGGTVGGVVFAMIASATGMVTTLLAAALCTAYAGLVVRRARRPQQRRTG